MRHSEADLLHPCPVPPASINATEHSLSQLEPSRYPRRIDLELSAEAMAYLDRHSASTGRPLRDTAADLLSQALFNQDQHQG